MLESVSIEQIVVFLRSKVEVLTKDAVGRRSCIMLMARDLGVSKGNIAGDDPNYLETDFAEFSRKVSNSLLPEFLEKFSKSIPPFHAPEGTVFFIGFNTFWTDYKTGQGGLSDVIVMVYQTGQSIVLMFKEGSTGAQMQTFEDLESFWKIFRLSPEEDTTSEDIIWN
jgi:hypothetical protein